MRRNIDIEIIWRKINGKLNSEEEANLQVWLAEDEKNYTYYKKAKRFLTKGSMASQKPIDITKARKRVAFKIFVSPVIRKASKVAAIFLAILMVSGLWYKIAQFSQSREAEMLIEPGSTKATLILSDGSRHNLEDETDVVLNDKGTVIINQGKELCYIYSKKEQPNIKATKEPVKMNTLKVPRGGEFFLILSDSTKVWINSETILRYPVTFTQANRNVEVIGEAFFEVAHDSLHPFIVNSGDHHIRVLGTAFNISAYPDEEQVQTTLVEGIVEIFSKKDEELNIRLSSGYQSVYQKGLGTVLTQKVNVNRYVAWKNGRYVFERQTLEEMMKILSRWYDCNVVFENDKARVIRFNGNLRRSDDLIGLLKIIESTNEVKFELNGKNVIVK